MHERCVLLLQLGGAASEREVFAFTYSLLSDPQIIRLPPWARKPLAFFIAAVRNLPSRKRYRMIGGSPIMEITRKQAIALQTLLDEQATDVKVFFAARHLQPSIESVVPKLTGMKHCLLLPLFPHYSFTTVRTCIDHATKVLTGAHPGMKIDKVEGFFDHPRYIRAQADLVKEHLTHVPGPRAVLFSAHSLPKGHVAAGDPYQTQVERSVALISERLPGDCKTFLGYQSQLSRRTWIGPPTVDLMHDIVRSGIRNVAVVPIAFVSEHFETLYELDIDYAHRAKAMGFDVFYRVPTLNTFPGFIEALAAITLQAL